MVASINAAGVFVAAPPHAYQHQNAARNDAGDGALGVDEVENVDDQRLLTLQQKFADMADDMANVATQFRSRRDIEKKNGAVDDNLERVLDDDAVGKSQKIVEIIEIRNISIENLLVQVRNLFPDDSDLFLVLKELLKRERLSQIQRGRLEELLKEVTREADQKMLKGGINCALKARLSGARLGLAARYLRQTYRRFLERDRRPLEDYEDWISCYGYKARHVVIDFVGESLSTDIRSEDPSCSHLEFGNLLAHMGKLNLLRTADSEFVTALSKKEIVAPYKDDGSGWLCLLFGLIQKKSDPLRLLTQALDGCHLSNHTERSIWLMTVRNAYGRLAPELQEIWDIEKNVDDDAENTSVQAVFDQLIEQSGCLEGRQQRVSFSK